MSVTNVNSVTNSSVSVGASAAGSTNSSTVDYNQFLQLLVSELKNQDPTSPTDPTQYMSQLASFSSVEQQVQTNSTLSALLSVQASSLVGRTITSSDGQISGVVSSVQTSSSGGASAILSDGQSVVLGSGVSVSS